MVTKIIVGKSRIRAEYLDDLKKAYEARRLVIFLGAGVSLPYGIPTWKDLVTDILINQSDGKYKNYLPSYRSALASWLSDELGFSPTLLARVIRYQINKYANIQDLDHRDNEYRRVVKDALYRTYNPDANSIPETTLSALVRIIEENEGEKRAFPAIVSFNFDNLLEKMLKDKNIDVKPIFSNERVNYEDMEKLPIIHVNGYLPYDDSVQNSELIFTEDEFNRLTFSQLNWAVSELTNYLRNYTVLFIGLSMSDPNLRRLLDGTCIKKGKPVHYLLRKDYQLNDKQLNRAKIEVEARAKENRTRIGDTEAKSDSSLREAIKNMLKHAHSYDRKLFKDMGVGTLWLTEHEDIPDLLIQITQRVT